MILNRSSKIDLSQLESHIASFERNQERTERALREEVALNREETSKSSRNLREEMVNSMTKISNVQQEQFDSFSKKLDTLTQSNEQKLDKMRETVEGRLKLLQDDNTKKLDQMRETVDEKLHATLEKRLGESFKHVSDRLEKVHQGLGEMQTLAAGVGDLKKVLTNVKTRGTWGEIQLGALLEQVLSGEQYEKNVVTKKGSNDRVEFAIKLPGHDDKDDQPVWLPIDAKFPREDYERLVEAQEKADAGLAEDAAKQLEVRIKSSAKEIKDKYLDPPHTTDFGIMFLPTEGLFAEVIKRPGLSDFLQREYRISVTGPTTLAALLNSLQMGFRTLTIEKRSSEVWSLLGAVKTEFGKFGTILDKTQKKLQEASNTIEDAAKKSRTIERKLKNVQELPSQEPSLITDEISDNDEAENDGVIT
ncbi:MAG: DNA recombination protein RmuC [Thermodesulfovibrionia bacterium]|nr:DNA recombination protein RmuC [Thermodesulfovibrionia bacterium]